MDDGSGVADRCQGNQGQGHPLGEDDAGEGSGREGEDQRHRLGGAGRRARRVEQHDRVPLQAAERADEGRRQKLQGRGHRVPGGIVRRQRSGRHGAGSRGGGRVRAHGCGARLGAVGADA